MTHRDTFAKTLQLCAAVAALVATPAVAFAADTTTGGTSTTTNTPVAAPAAQPSTTTAVASTKPRAKHAARIPGTFAINTDEELRQAMLPAGPRVLSGDGGG